jgi:hypothetical protein
MASTKSEYGSPTTITVTLASLTASATAGRESTAVDNSTDKYLDALVSGVLVSSGSAAAGSKTVYIYAYASLGGSEPYTDTATGTDGAVTPTNLQNLRLIGTVYMPTVSTTYEFGPFSVAAAFGWILPPKWGLIFINDTGQTLPGSGHSVKYQGQYATTA